MPSNEDQPHQLIDPFMAEVMEGMMRSTATITERVMDNQLAEIKRWKERYVSLYESVDKAAMRITTRELEAVLFDHGWTVENARESLMETSS
jgi:hypothetical protein